MRVSTLRFVISALVSGAILSGCAGGGSSATHGAGTVPITLQGSASGAQSSGRHAHSGARRTLSAPTCSGTGTGAFVGSPGSPTDGPNVADGEWSVVGGGEGNQACDGWSTVAGGYMNAVSGTDDADQNNFDGFIGGGEYNVVTGIDMESAVVGGYGNLVSTNESAIVDGESNSVVARGSLVGSGYTNEINQGGLFSAIVSGYGNKLSGEYGFIGAGESNTVSGKAATIGGGYDSLASGSYATVPGGYANYATGTGSFAAGVEAYAGNAGTFVWADDASGAKRLQTTVANEFLARASGGFTLYTNAGATVGAKLAAGSGAWASLSDRNAKTSIAPLDETAVLEKVAALPISRWSYKSEHGVRHVGPMAQDFYAAFKVGEDDKHITSIDEDGVALAAIKALHATMARCTPRTRRYATGSRPMRRTFAGSMRSSLTS